MMVGRFRPQRWYPRYASVLERTSRLPGLLAPATLVLTPLGKDRTPHDDEFPTGIRRASLRYFVCSFPRTGTTYLHASLLAAGVDESSVWKSHNVFDIDAAQAADIPVIVTVREPLATVLSWSVYNGDRLDPVVFQGRFDAYTTWYRQALRARHRRAMTFVAFSDVTAQPSKVVASVGLDATRITSARILDILNTTMAEDDVSLAQGHIPSLDRAALAARQTELLTHPSVLRARRRAEQVYADLQRELAGGSRRWPWISSRGLATSGSVVGAGALGLAAGLRFLS